MKYKQFCQNHKPTQKQIFALFFDYFEHKFSIKNKKIAVKNLEKIIHATFKLSANQSFAKMTLRELSKQSTLSMGGLYAYIQNKQQLSDFITQFLNYFALKILNEVSQKNHQIDLDELIKTHIYISEFMHPWFFFVFMESKNQGKKQRQNVMESELLMEQRLIDCIELGQKQGLYNTQLQASISARFIKSLLHDWYLKRWKYKQKKINIDDYCQSLLTFIHRGLINE